MKKQGKGRTANRRAGLIFALLVMIAMALGLSAAAAKEAFPSDAGLLFDLEGDWRYGQTPPTFYVYDWEKDTKYATDGEIICTYYCNVDGQRVLTNAENSGADSPGGIPRKVGSYEVEATVTETDHYAGGQALGEFSIDQATPTASLFSFSVSPDSAYDGKAKTVIITPKETVGEITVHCFKDGTPVTSPTLPGEYTFSIDVEENENYQGLDNLTDGSWKFTISPRALTLTGITIYDLTEERELWDGMPSQSSRSSVRS